MFKNVSVSYIKGYIIFANYKYFLLKLTHLATYIFWPGIHELVLLLNYQYMGDREPVHFDSFKS